MFIVHEYKTYVQKTGNGKYLTRSTKVSKFIGIVYSKTENTSVEYFISNDEWESRTGIDPKKTFNPKKTETKK